MTVGIPLRFGYSLGSVFNGGKSQVNPEYLLVGGAYPFINMMKTMQSWTYISPAAPVNPLDLDSDGYPTVIHNSGVSNILFFPPSLCDGSTVWVCTWDGRGAAFVGGATTTLGSFTNTVGSSPNRVEFTLPISSDGQFTVGITALASSIDYIHNMQIFLKSEETALLAGQIIGTKFMNILKAGKPGVMRFLNWQNTNYGCVTTYASEKPETYYSYYADEYRAAWTATANGGAGDAFTATFGSGAPTDKLTVLVTWSHDAAGTAWTFNLNGTGAVTMINGGEVPYGQDAARAPSNGQVACLVFDADMNTWIKYGGWPSNQSGIRSGIPPSVLVKICGKLGMHPYFLVPNFACDPSSDWLVSVDNYIKANGPAWMIPRYEGPNENWNAGFFAYYYSLQKAGLHWGTQFNGNHHWCGYISSKLGQLIDANRSSDRTKYQFIVGVQSATYPNASESNPRLNTVRASGYMLGAFSNGTANVTTSAGNTTLAVNDPVTIVPQGDPVPNMPGGFTFNIIYFVKTVAGSTITLSATVGGGAISCTGTPGVTISVCRAVANTGLCAYNWVTTVCCTQYVNANQQNQTTEITTGWNVLNGNTSGVAAYESDNDISTGLAASYTAWYTWANSFGPAMKLCGYEGGWSPDYYNATTYNVYGAILGITQANPCVVNIPATISAGTFQDGHGFVIGMPLCGQEWGSGGGMTQFFTAPLNVSFNTGTPGSINWTSHGFAGGQSITFGAKGGGQNTGFNWAGGVDMPSPLTPGIVYYVKTVLDANTFTVAATSGSSAINITSQPNATVSAQKCYVVTGVSGSNVTLSITSTGFSAYTTRTVNASASWSIGAGVITTGANPGGVANGSMVYDSNTSQPIGVVADYTGTTLVLNSGAIHASSGSADTLLFCPGIGGYGNLAPGAGAAGGVNMVNAVRHASKSVSALQADTVLNYNNFVAAGARAEFPSCFTFAGQDNVWSVWDPDIYASPTPPQWLGITQFNA